MGNSITARQHVAQDLASKEQVEDTYFLDWGQALSIARQGNMIERDGIRRLQLCYFDGPDFDEAPANMISVPLAEFSGVFGGSMLPLPTRIQPARKCDENQIGEVTEAFAEMIADLAAFRAENPRGAFRFGRDSYFFSSKDAYREAVQQKLVDLNHPTVTGLQVCYFDGAEISDALPNMIHLPAEQVCERLLDARTRQPQAVRIPFSTPNEVRDQLIGVFETLMQQVMHDKLRRMAERREQARKLAPTAGPGEPLKVMLVTSRITQVLQFTTFGMARAFESLGHEVCVSIERSPLEQSHEYEVIQEYIDFAPDVVFIIDHLRNDWLHPDVTFVAWYQDLMPPLQEREQLSVRANDQIYSASVELDGYLHDCGVEQVHRQGFCIDSAVFHPPVQARRRNRIVFVGSAYAPKVTDGPKVMALGHALRKRVEQGEVFSRSEIETMADAAGVDREQAFWVLYHFLTRDLIVHWLCKHLPGLGIEVEIYGRYWANDPVVAPYYRGEIEHGEALAELYRSSRYALVCHPFEINSQRLAEVSACGCIPVVYDCRRVATRPHWDEQCLFFNTEQELCALLVDEPPVRDLGQIAAGRTYQDFARKIVQQHRSRLAD